MGKLIEIKGKKFGQLTVLSYVGQDNERRSLWLCKCDCGTVKEIKGRDLRNGDSKTCGCSHKIRPYEALYNGMCSRAKQAGHEVYLTYEDFVSFTSIIFCVYCGSVVTWTKVNPKHTGCRYNLDRKDNSVGYTKDNCAVCCKECNLIKGARFTYEQMLQIGALIKTWRT